MGNLQVLLRCCRASFSGKCGNFTFSVKETSKKGRNCDLWNPVTELAWLSSMWSSPLSSSLLDAAVFAAGSVWKAQSPHWEGGAEHGHVHRLPARSKSGFLLPPLLSGSKRTSTSSRQPKVQPRCHRNRPLRPPLGWRYWWCCSMKNISPGPGIAFWGSKQTLAVAADGEYVGNHPSVTWRVDCVGRCGWQPCLELLLSVSF